MKTLELKIDDNSVEVVLSILENLKDGLIREISVKKNSKNDSDLEEFRQLVRKGNNSKKLRYENAVNTDEMIDDIL